MSNSLNDMAQHNEEGVWGEEEAAHYLESKGYKVCERDWKCGKRDIDIIALTPDDKIMAFVEVKTRSSDDYIDPIEAVDYRKIRNLGWAADAYIRQYNISKEVRFDIVSIVGVKPMIDKIEHIENAFNPLLL